MYKHEYCYCAHCRRATERANKTQEIKADRCDLETFLTDTACVSPEI